MKKILVTGATGFVGSCLARRLVHLGHRVDVIIRDTSDTWRLESILDDLRVHEADLCDPESLERTIAEIRPEVVFHQAAYGTFSFQQDPGLVFRVNLLGTVNLLYACLRHGFERFVNTGSSSEYGVKTEPMRETDFPEPLGAYGVAKAAATMYCRSVGVENDAGVVNLRLFSPYGPWEDPRRLIPYVISSLLRGVSPRLSTPGSVRDFIFIDDVLDAYLRVMDTDLPPGDILNIGSGVQHTIGEVVEAILAATGSSVEPAWGAMDQQRPEPDSWVADIGKPEARLGWKPFTSLVDGVRSDVDWFKENLDFYPEASVNR